MLSGIVRAYIQVLQTATKFVRKFEFFLALTRKFLGKNLFSWSLYQVLIHCPEAIKVIHSQIMFTFTCTKTFVCKALHAGVYCAAVHQWILSALSYGRIPAETLDIMMAFWKEHCPSIPILTIQELLVLPLPFMDVNYFHDFLSLFLQMHHGGCVSSIQKMIGVSLFYRQIWAFSGENGKEDGW